MERKKWSRRSFLGLAAGAAAGVAMAACQPKTVIVKETVVVKEEVEKVVKETVVVKEQVEKVVKETVVVTEKEPVTLNFFNRGGAYIAEVMDSQMKLYQQSHPEISFEINAVADYSHQEALLMMIAAGTGPDVWFDANRTTGMLTRKGVTMDLEPFLEADPNFVEDDYVDNVWIAQTYDGKRWGLPWDSGAMCMAFNTDLFDKAGVEYPDPQVWMTWDEIVELGKQLTFDMDGNTPNDAGFDPKRVMQYGFLPDLGHGRQTYMWANDAEIIDADGSVPMDSDKFIEAMNWLADLGLKHYVSPTPAFQAATTMDFQQGNIAMQHIGVWSLGRINDVDIKWGTFQVPYNTTQTSYGHYSPLCVLRKTKYPQEAYDFAFFATCSFDGEKILVDLGMQQPIRKDLREQFLNNPAPPDPMYRQVFYDAFENQQTFRWPGDKIGSYYGGWYQILIEYWGPYLDRLWLGEVRWEDVAKEVRAGSEQILETGEIS
jgi:multiple sugar transport system substrate-binding protein